MTHLNRLYIASMQVEVLRLSPGSVVADICILTDPDQEASLIIYDEMYS